MQEISRITLYGSLHPASSKMPYSHHPERTVTMIVGQQVQFKKDGAIGLIEVLNAPLARVLRFSDMESVVCRISEIERYVSKCIVCGVTMTNKNESGSCTQMRKVEGVGFILGDWWCPVHNPRREQVQQLVRSARSFH
jgi:hypothetical protein